MRDGLKKILSLDSEIQVTCEAEDGAEVLQRLEEGHLADVILMDVRMPRMDGIQASEKVHSRFPSVKIIILTTFNEDEYLFRGIRTGISGYLLKDSDIDYILKSIHEAYAGNMVFDPGVTPKLVGAVNRGQPPVQADLTNRENEIAQLVALGESNQEIASELYLSEGTVKNTISRILKKRGLQRRTQLTAQILGGQDGPTSILRKSK